MGAEQETNFAWVLDSYKKVSLERIKARLDSVLQGFIERDMDEDELPNYEPALLRYLGRDLTAREIYRLRAVLSAIGENLYGEE